jgi:hypothetical protein
MAGVDLYRDPGPLLPGASDQLANPRFVAVEVQNGAGPRFEREAFELAEAVVTQGLDFLPT